jgi:hypothetical protein
VGDYKSGTVAFNESLRRAWNRSPLIANPRCHSCAYAFYCGGGCDWQGKNAGDEYYDKFCPDFMRDFRTGLAEDYAVAVAARLRSIEVDANGRPKLTDAERTAILQEVSGKLKERNTSVCTSSCSSQIVKDSALLHQKKTGLVQLLRKEVQAVV